MESGNQTVLEEQSRLARVVLVARTNKLSEKREEGSSEVQNDEIGDEKKNS